MRSIALLIGALFSIQVMFAVPPGTPPVGMAGPYSDSGCTASTSINSPITAGSASQTVYYKATNNAPTGSGLIFRNMTISGLTADFISASGCTDSIGPQASCVITMTIASGLSDVGTTPTQQVQLNYGGRGPAKSTSFTVQVNSLTYTSFAYIADLGLSGAGSLDFCAQNSSGLLVGSTCTTTGSGVTFQNPVAVAINPHNASQIFVADSGGTYGNIYSCTINANGSVSDCSDTGFATQIANYIGSGHIFAKAISISVNSNGTTAYITDGNSGAGGDVVYAPITSGSFGTINSACSGDDCSNSGGSIYLGSANSIALNSSATRAYIASNQNGKTGVYQCPISSNAFSSCTLVKGGNLTSPISFALNSGGTYAYVTNASSNTVAVCPVSSGNLSNSCNTPTVGANLVGIGLNAAGTYAYVTSYNNSDTTNSFVYSCPVSGSTLSACTQASSFTGGFSLSKPNGVSAS